MGAGRPKKPIAQLVYEGSYNPKIHGDRSRESIGEIVTSIDTPKNINPLADQLFQSLVKPLCARGLIESQDVSDLIFISYLIDEIVHTKTEIDNCTDRKLRSQLANTLTKTILAYSTKVYRYYVTPVERARVVTEIKKGTVMKSIAERIIDDQKEKNSSRAN